MQASHPSLTGTLASAFARQEWQVSSSSDMLLHIIGLQQVFAQQVLLQNQAYIDGNI
jgi:hypothetical protein